MNRRKNHGDAFMLLLHSVLTAKTFANISHTIYLTLGIFPNIFGDILFFSKPRSTCWKFIPIFPWFLTISFRIIGLQNIPIFFLDLLEFFSCIKKFLKLFNLENDILKLENHNPNLTQSITQIIYTQHDQLDEPIPKSIFFLLDLNLATSKH